MRDFGLGDLFSKRSQKEPTSIPPAQSAPGPRSVRRVDGWVGHGWPSSAAPDDDPPLPPSSPDGPGSSDTREAVEPEAPEEQATTSKPASERSGLAPPSPRRT